MLGVAPCLRRFRRNRELAGWNRGDEHQSKYALRVDSSDTLSELAAHAETDKHESSCSLGIGNREHILRELIQCVTC